MGISKLLNFLSDAAAGASLTTHTVQEVTLDDVPPEAKKLAIILCTTRPTKIYAHAMLTTQRIRWNLLAGMKRNFGRSSVRSGNARVPSPHTSWGEG
jgi:hypothetical protein